MHAEVLFSHLTVLVGYPITFLPLLPCFLITLLPLLPSHLCHYVTSVTVTSLPLLHAVTLLPS